MPHPAFLPQRQRRYKYYEIMRRAYRLSDDECECLAGLYDGDDAVVEWASRNNANIKEDLQVKFNTNDLHRLIEFAGWLCTGEGPLTTDRPRLKFCSPQPDGCGLAFGLDMFPFWPLDDRCALCIKRCVSPDPTHMKRVEAGRALQSMLNIAKRPDVMSPHISSVLGNIYALAGGPQGFANFVWDHIIALKEKDPAAFGLSKMLIGLMNLTSVATKLDQETINLDDIDDAGLKRYLQDMLLKKLNKEEATRFIEEAVVETEALVRDAKAQRETCNAEAELTSIV